MLLGTERQPCRREISPLGVSTAFPSTRRALDEHIAEFRQPAVAQLAEQAVGLHPAERLLHLLALALAHPVTGVTRRSAVNPPPERRAATCGVTPSSRQGVTNASTS